MHMRMTHTARTELADAIRRRSKSVNGGLGNMANEASGNKNT